MVRAGLGYSIVPRMAVNLAEDRDGLNVHSLEPALHRTLGRVMRQDRVMNRGIHEVIHHLEEAVGAPADNGREQSCGNA